MPVKAALLVHRRNYQEPAIRSQDAYHPDPASPPRLSWGHCCSGLSPDPGTPSAQRLAPSNLTDVQVCSLQQPTIKHRGQPTTAHPEACLRCPRKILVAQATAIPLKRLARHMHRKAPPMWPTQRSTRKDYGLNSKLQRRRLHGGYDVKDAAVT